MVFWATPQMTATHLVFAAALTAYILAAIRWEERDLVDAHPEYADYRRRVPMLIPRRPKPAAGAEAGPARNPVASSGDLTVWKLPLCPYTSHIDQVIGHASTRGRAPDE
jgi:hypothetical protein